MEVRKFRVTRAYRHVTLPTTVTLSHEVEAESMPVASRKTHRWALANVFTMPHMWKVVKILVRDVEEDLLDDIYELDPETGEVVI